MAAENKPDRRSARTQAEPRVVASADLKSEPPPAVTALTAAQCRRADGVAAHVRNCGGGQLTRDELLARAFELGCLQLLGRGVG